MAHTILSSNYQKKAICLLGLLVLTLSMMQTSDATEFPVGGTKRWSPDSTDYNQWAEKNRFQIGDKIAFEYPAGNDSVLVVNNDDYTNCNTDSPIQKFDTGNTVIEFKNSGPHYFISGNKDNCLKNQKLIVVVLADRSNGNSNQTDTASPPPSGSNETTPPPAGSVEINPTPAPISETPPPPPPSGASANFVSFIGYMGAFAASSLLLVF